MVVGDVAPSKGANEAVKAMDSAFVTAEASAAWKKGAQRRPSRTAIAKPTVADFAASIQLVTRLRKVAVFAATMEVVSGVSRKGVTKGLNVVASVPAMAEPATVSLETARSRIEVGACAPSTVAGSDAIALDARSPLVGKVCVTPMRTRSNGSRSSKMHVSQTHQQQQ